MSNTSHDAFVWFQNLPSMVDHLCTSIKRDYLVTDLLLLNISQLMLAKEKEIMCKQMMIENDLHLKRTFTLMF